jgi:RimJ/RimL family protein N-acetyltransferase
MLLALKLQSLHGATKSLEESRNWMCHHLDVFDNWFYAVFLRDSEAPDGLGHHLGSVSLRHMDKGAELLPPSSFDDAEEVGTGGPLSSEEVRGREALWRTEDLNLRVLGYALFGSAQGKGYATEACKGLLDGYSESVEKWKGSGEGKEDAGKTAFYVEAGVDQENPGSQNVLRKLGFRTVGLKIEKEKAWLNGAWRGPGWWITGMYV